jgi:arsenate reductase (thioredoxin)
LNPDSHPHVLFVCVENAGRSQIARALFASLSDGFGEARSAGTEPADNVHQHVIGAMAERGIDLSNEIPKALTVESAEWADLIVTMGCGDRCPVTGKPTEDWELPDPKTMPTGDLSSLIDDIRIRVVELLDRLRTVHA